MLFRRSTIKRSDRRQFLLDTFILMSSITAIVIALVMLYLVYFHWRITNVAPVLLFLFLLAEGILGLRYYSKEASD